jgi:coenzyme Q-binding protein COQ10
MERLAAVRFHHEQDSPYVPEQLFRIAVDIESYPRFVPWCIATRIRERQPNRLVVDNVFGAGPLRLRFATVAEFELPTRIDIASADEPFEHLAIAWHFAARPEGGSRVAFTVDQTLRSHILEMVSGLFVEGVQRRIVAAFEARAEVLYGRSPRRNRQ